MWNECVWIHKMDLRNKMLLQHYHKDLVRDLDVTYIIDELFAKEAISTEDFDTVFQLEGRTERVRYVLDVIVTNGTNHSYQVFVDTLAKDYSWLWEKLNVDNAKMSILNDSFEDSLSRGDVPRLPDHYVSRVKLENDVGEKLRLLTRHKILVLHGMSGCGKSAVAVGVLRNNPDLVTSNFNGVVFWLNLGNVKTDDDIVAHQTKLQRKASSMYTHRDGSYMNSSISMSSIGSNADSHSLTSYDWSWQELRDMLKKTFADPSLKDALLVLDEVNEKRIVEAFDIGCKLLITTRDTDVVAKLNPQIVKIENNFEEREALQFFASCLDIDVSELPRQAKKLVEICKGSPFHITLIGAQLAENKERLIHDHRSWNYYIDKLAKKEFFFLPRHTDNPMKTIEMCIKSLKPNILPLYIMLGILPDNVKVSAKVLSKLWNIDIPQVEAIMKQLRSKSLINEYYDQDQRNYIYEIHDLIMNYLRTCISDDEKKRMHVKFLKSYNYDTLENTPELTDDGYIAFYIGHHIRNTGNLNGKWSLFKMFLNLKFLGNKVRLTGPADVIMDLQEYGPDIATNELDNELLMYVKSFLSTHGNDLYRFPCTDIIQSILQHESKGLLYAKAYQIARERCEKNELYFEFLHEQNVEEIKHTTIDVKENISSVCFLYDYVLVGTISGAIKVYHINTNTLKKELPGTKDPIKWVSTCPANPLIAAALTSGGFLKLWHMNDLYELEEDVIEEECEEIPYNGNYAPVSITPIKGPFLSCRWMNNAEQLIAHSQRLITIYSIDGKLVKDIDNFDRDKVIITVVPTNDDRYIIAATCVNNTHYIEVFDLSTKERVVSFEESIPVLNVICVPGSNRILIFNETAVIEHEFKSNNNTYSQNIYNTYHSRKVIYSNDVKENLTFISAAVNKCGSLLFISTNDSRIVCVDLKTNTYVFHLDNRRGDVVSMATSEVLFDEFVPGSDVLLSGTGSIENTVKVWSLDSSYVSQTMQKHRKFRLTTKFDVSFLQTLSPHTPGHSTPPSELNSNHSTPKRNKSFAAHSEQPKKTAKKTMSLDRHSLKPLNLKGICNVNEDGSLQPLLAVVDDKNNIQIIRGRKVLTEITVKSDDKINNVQISPCNQYVIFGLQSGVVKKYYLRTKESKIIMDVASTVQYLKFVNPNLLVVAGKNRCLMAYRFGEIEWKLEMLQKGDMNLGSQEILNDIQGNKKKNGQNDSLSQSGSEASLTSRGRSFPSETKTRFCKGSSLVECFWVDSVGMITVENNASVKLWSTELKLLGVLNGRQTDVYVNCASFQKNVLVICDDYGKFQLFDLKENETGDVSLHTTYENKVNYKIISCDLTTDGHILAMGLDSGDVVIWNVLGKCQLNFLRYHKNKVQSCMFSPVPERLYRSNSAVQSPIAPQMFNFKPNTSSSDDDQPPLVLVTMASEIVWWNVTYLMRNRPRGIWRARINVLSPVPSPLDPRSTDLTARIENLKLNKNSNFFFGDDSHTYYDCWETMWKRKTFKEGSKRKEILACIKLSGMNSKRLCHDEKFSCFVTVDNPGHVHIMNAMKTTS